MAASSELRKHVVILFGATGTGKSTFLNAVLQARERVGHGLRSCTQELSLVPGKINGVSCALVDTPGFDDTDRKENDVVEDICSWLAEAKLQGLEICGVIYLHRITDPRIGGVGRRTMSLFRQICGDDAMSHVILCTTRWDEVDPAMGENRERELQDDFWREMLRKGSSLARHDNTPASAQKIVAKLLENAGISLKAQIEMVDEGKSYEQTSAAKEVQAELERLIAKQAVEMENLKKELLSAHESDMASIKDELAQAARRSEQLQEDLRSARQSAAARDAEARETQAELQRLIAGQEAHVKNLKTEMLTAHQKDMSIINEQLADARRKSDQLHQSLLAAQQRPRRPWWQKVLKGVLPGVLGALF